MNTIENEKIDQEKGQLKSLVEKYGLSKELVFELKKMGYELKNISTSWKYYNQSGDILDFAIKSKSDKYLTGHYIGVGCGAKQMGKVNATTSWCIYQGFVKQVL